MSNSFSINVNGVSDAPPEKPKQQQDRPQGPQRTYAVFYQMNDLGNIYASVCRELNGATDLNAAYQLTTKYNADFCMVRTYTTTADLNQNDPTERNELGTEVFRRKLNAPGENEFAFKKGFHRDGDIYPGKQVLIGGYDPDKGTIKVPFGKKDKEGDKVFDVAPFLKEDDVMHELKPVPAVIRDGENTYSVSLPNRGAQKPETLLHNEKSGQFEPISPTNMPHVPPPLPPVNQERMDALSTPTLANGYKAYAVYIYADSSGGLNVSGVVALSGKDNLLAQAIDKSPQDCPLIRVYSSTSDLTKETLSWQFGSAFEKGKYGFGTASADTYNGSLPKAYAEAQIIRGEYDPKTEKVSYSTRDGKATCKVEVKRFLGGDIYSYDMAGESNAKRTLKILDSKGRIHNAILGWPIQHEITYDPTAKTAQITLPDPNTIDGVFTETPANATPATTAPAITAALVTEQLEAGTNKMPASPEDSLPFNGTPTSGLQNFAGRIGGKGHGGKGSGGMGF
jgi:hypothetical protein